MYDVKFTKQAQKDAVRVERAGLKLKAAEIIATIRKDPYNDSHSFERLKRLRTAQAAFSLGMS
ncbi:MAG: hypothetical protein LBC86_02280 [Oscillospiraceae bacterium]|jgi:Txe/YoeB family toxin of Txe-Axe toxin-antitoxin module|nr:hypothetical protein [Oscillospiraceae bacterium]